MFYPIEWGSDEIVALKDIVSSISGRTRQTNGRKFELNGILTWDEVSVIHRSRNGIYHVDGHLVSLLTDFGKINPSYQDRYGDGNDVISYTGAGRRGDQKPDRWNRAMLAAIESGHAVPLFCKLGVNRWQFLGYWRVASAEYVFDEPQQRMLWKFRLERSF